MEESLGNEQTSFSSLVDRIKKTKIYQKIVAEEEKEIQTLIEKNNIKVEQDHKYKDHLKKNKLLMGLTESLLNELNQNTTGKMERPGGGFPKDKDKKNKTTKNIGFIFFNSNVILEPSNAQEKTGRVIVCDTQGTFSSKAEGMSRERVNFDDFESLYKLGANYGQEYNTRLNEFQFSNLDYNFGDSNSGQTALGPAVAIASGVISQHGAGSSIIVVTDGIGNRGIFDQSERWEDPLKLLRLRL